MTPKADFKPSVGLGYIADSEALRIKLFINVEELSKLPVNDKGQVVLIGFDNRAKNKKESDPHMTFIQDRPKEQYQTRNQTTSRPTATARSASTGTGGTRLPFKTNQY